MNPRLTVTYGLRWDVNPPLKGKDLENQPFTVNGLDQPATMALAPRGTPLYRTTYGNVAPRVGLVYQSATRPPGTRPLARRSACSTTLATARLEA